MGNSSDKKKISKDNRIVVEFLTPNQKTGKQKVLQKYQQEIHDNDSDGEFEIIGKECNKYEVEYKKTIYCEDKAINMNILHNQIINITGSQDWQEVQYFFDSNVKSYQMFFNDHEIKEGNQIHTFTDNQPVIVEIIYRKKSFFERMIGQFQSLTRKVSNGLKNMGWMLKTAQPLLIAIRITNPIILPALLTLRMGLQLTNSTDQNARALSIISLLVNSITKTTEIVVPILGKLSNLIPTSLMGISLRGGHNSMIFNYIIYVFFPFMTPFLLVLGV